MALQFPDVNEELVEKIVDKLKSQGIFDQFRKDCLADVDSRPAYTNLKDKVNGAVADFLSKQLWKDDLNKIQLRESLRNHVQQHYLEVGVNKIVEQVVNPKIFSVFMPKVEDIVYQVMGLEKPASTDDRTRLRFLMSNNINQGNVFSDNLLSDLDPISPGSMNESGNESANLNDSIASKIVDDSDNVSRDVNKESNLEINELSNESKLSGMSELSSHGSTTKLDISESAHLPGDKSEMHCDISNLQTHSNASDRNKSKGGHEMASCGYDFDNFSNLKEKLMKSDPLNKNLDKDRNDPSYYITTKVYEGSDMTRNDNFKEFKDKTISMSERIDDNKPDRGAKSPTSILYSEDSVGSNGSQRSKLKLEKIHLLNESTRNSIAMDCDDSSTSLMEKKIEVIKEIETVSCIESLKEESQMSLASNDSRRFNNFENLKVISECSQNLSAVSSPDASKNIIDDKKKDDGYRKSSHSSRSRDRHESKHRSRNLSRDKNYSRDSKSQKYSSSNRDKCSSRSRDDRHRNDSKSNQKSSSDDVKRERDSRHGYDDKYRRDKDSKHRSGDDHRSSRNRGKDSSRNSSEDDKKAKLSDAKDKDVKSDKSSREKSSHDSKYNYRKDDYKKSSDYSKSKEGESKYNSADQKNSSSKEKSLKSSEDDRYFKKEKDLKKSDDFRSLKNRDKDEYKNSSSADMESKSGYDRKSSSSKYKDSKSGNEDEKSSQKDKSKNSDPKSDLKSNIDDKSNIGSDSKTDKKPNIEKKEDISDKRKSLSDTVVKKDDKDSKKKKRENCSQDTEKKESRRSRDRDDGGNRSGSSLARDQKESSDKKRKSTSSKQDKPISSDKDNSAKDQLESNNCLNKISSSSEVLLVKGSTSKDENVCNELNKEEVINAIGEQSDVKDLFPNSDMSVGKMKDICISKKKVEIVKKDALDANEISSSSEVLLVKGSTSKDEIVCNELIKEDVINAVDEQSDVKDLFPNSDMSVGKMKDISISKEEVEIVKKDALNANQEVNSIIIEKQKESSYTNCEEFGGENEQILSSNVQDVVNMDVPVKNCDNVVLLQNQKELVSPCSVNEKELSLYPNTLEILELGDTINKEENEECSKHFSDDTKINHESFSHCGFGSENVVKPSESSANPNHKGEINPDYEFSETMSNNEVSDDEFIGFNQSSMDLSFKSAMNFENFLKNKHGSPLNAYFSDKCFSLTDNNLNNIDIKTEIGFLIDNPETETGLLPSCSVESDYNDKLLSPLSTSLVQSTLKENIHIPEDPGALKTGAKSYKIKTNLTPEMPKSKDEEIKSSSHMELSENITQTIPSDETVGIGDSSSSDRAFTLPPVTEDMLDNFMMKNIVDKMDGGYNSSDSDTEGWNVPITPDVIHLTGVEKDEPLSEEEINVAKDSPNKKNKSRMSQSYSVGDLYKPRPLISNPSRRNRVSNKNGSKPSRGAKRAADSLESRENKRPR